MPGMGHLKLIYKAILVMISPVVILVSLALAVGFFQLVVQFASGNYKADLPSDIAIYIIFLPALAAALGVRKILRML